MKTLTETWNPELFAEIPTVYIIKNWRCSGNGEFQRYLG